MNMDRTRGRTPFSRPGRRATMDDHSAPFSPPQWQQPLSVPLPNVPLPTAGVPFIPPPPPTAGFGHGSYAPQSPEEPFVAVNPFEQKRRWGRTSRPIHQRPAPLDPRRPVPVPVPGPSQYPYPPVGPQPTVPAYAAPPVPQTYPTYPNVGPAEARPGWENVARPSAPVIPERPPTVIEVPHPDMSRPSRSTSPMASTRRHRSDRSPASSPQASVAGSVASQPGDLIIRPHSRSSRESYESLSSSHTGSRTPPRSRSRSDSRHSGPGQLVRIPSGRQSTSRSRSLSRRSRSPVAVLGLFRGAAPTMFARPHHRLSRSRSRSRSASSRRSSSRSHSRAPRSPSRSPPPARYPHQHGQNNPFVLPPVIPPPWTNGTVPPVPVPVPMPNPRMSYFPNSGVKYEQSISSLPLPVTASTTLASSFGDRIQDITFSVLLFILDVIPRQLYLHFLLRIPSMYFSRVTRIFEDAQLSLPDIKKMARARAEQWNPAEPDNPRWPTTFIQQMPNVNTDPLPRSLLIFRSNWDNFIDDLMSEWQTLNIVSVLLMSAILTMLQIDSASHPITRTSALFSLICSLMSLLYGCIYIIRFGSMRKMYKASSFAEEAQKSTTSIWWNVWVLLAMPAVWLAWAMICFFVCIMSFVWLTGSTNDPSDVVLSPRAALGLRIALTAVFSLGLIYFVLIVQTFHRYGDPLDREWMRRVNEWSREVWAAPYGHGQTGPLPPAPPPVQLPLVPVIPSPSSSPKSFVPRSVTPETGNRDRRRSVPVEPTDSLRMPRPRMPQPPPVSPQSQQPSEDNEPFKLMRLGHYDVEPNLLTPPWAETLDAEDLRQFVVDISSVWRRPLALGYGDVEDDVDLPPPSPSDVPLPEKAESVSSEESSSSGGRVRPSNALVVFSPPSPSNDHGTLPVSTSRRPSLPVIQYPSPPSWSTLTRPKNIHEYIALWNERYFYPRNMQVSLVPLDDRSLSPGYVISLGRRRTETDVKLIGPVQNDRLNIDTTFER